MSRIYTNVAALTAQRSLSKATDMQNTTLQRLSTGLKINTGKDDPSVYLAEIRVMRFSQRIRPCGEAAICKR